MWNRRRDIAGYPFVVNDVKHEVAIVLQDEPEAS